MRVLSLAQPARAIDVGLSCVARRSRRFQFQLTMHLSFLTLKLSFEQGCKSCSKLTLGKFMPGLVWQSFVAHGPCFGVTVDSLLTLLFPIVCPRLDTTSTRHPFIQLPCPRMAALPLPRRRCTRS
jgi:hypothetical protein